MIEIHDQQQRGFIICNKGFIELIYVDDRHRNKGIGSNLIQKCIQQAKNRKLPKLWLIAEPAEKENRSKLMRFYKRHGFKVESGNKLVMKL